MVPPSTPKSSKKVAKSVEPAQNVTLKKKVKDAGKSSNQTVATALTTSSMSSSITYPPPPYSLVINRRRSHVVAKVTLHHIPPQYIDFDPTPTRFRLNTFKWTKKLSVNVPFPDDVTTDACPESEAKFVSGILTAIFAVTHDPVTGLDIVPARPSNRRLDNDFKESSTKINKRKISEIIENGNSKLIVSKVKPKKAKTNNSQDSSKKIALSILEDVSKKAEEDEAKRVEQENKKGSQSLMDDLTNRERRKLLRGNMKQRKLELSEALLNNMRNPKQGGKLIVAPSTKSIPKRLKKKM